MEYTVDTVDLDTVDTVDTVYAVYLYQSVVGCVDAVYLVYCTGRYTLGFVISRIRLSRKRFFESCGGVAKARKLPKVAGWAERWRPFF